jgi:hypothetical protein
MPICHQHKFIFFHIPRCGGTSVESILGLQTLEHMHGVIEIDEQIVTLHHLTPQGMLELDLIEENLLKSYFKFAIIRDPFERMASDYIWQKHHDPFKQFAKMDFDQYLSFAERVMNEELYFKRRHYDHFRPMKDYCYHNQQLAVDEILLLENIDQELERIAPMVGHFQLPTQNASSPHYEYLRTSANIDKVENLYAKDKEMYERIKLEKYGGHSSVPSVENFGRA